MFLNFFRHLTSHMVFMHEWFLLELATTQKERLQPQETISILPHMSKMPVLFYHLPFLCYSIFVIGIPCFSYLLSKEIIPCCRFKFSLETLFVMTYSCYFQENYLMDLFRPAFILEPIMDLPFLQCQLWA